MSDDLNDLLQEDVLQHDIEHSEQNTEMALFISEPFQDAQSDDESVRSNSLYASQYSANSNMPKSILRAEGLNKSFRVSKIASIFCSTESLRNTEASCGR